MNTIQQKIKIIRFGDRVLDMVLLAIAARIAIIFEQIFHDLPWDTVDNVSFSFFSLPLIFVIWLVLITVIEKNALYRVMSYQKIFMNTIIIHFVGITSTITLDFILKSNLFHRTTIIFFGIIAFCFLLSKRWLLKSYLSYIRQGGLDNKNILIIGSKNRAKYLIDEFEKHREYGFVIRAILDPDPEKRNQKINGYTIIGDVQSIYQRVLGLSIDEVFFALPLRNVPDLKQIFSFLSSVGVNYHIMVNSEIAEIDYNSLRTEPKMLNYYGIPMVSFHALKANLYQLYIKNILEKSTALVLLILSIPILLLSALLIKLTSKGPIFYYQERVGLHGRRFHQYKLRSMVVDAEDLREDLEHLNEQTGPVFKISKDPRITHVGKYLRKFSIDELPQILNVLKGEMNLIGPRPPIPDEVAKYRPHQIRRLSMKPGITGLWQVSGRNDIPNFDDWVKLDLQYIDNWSLWLDLRILLKTVKVVFSGSGK